MLLPNREPRRIPPPALPPDTSAPEHSAAPLEALSILVVDDNSTVLRAVAKSLRGEGGDVTEAETLAAARHALAERRFDLILCDWKLGDEDGFRDLLLLEEHRHAARVGLSAYYNAHAAVDAQESGAVVLLKPFSTTELMAAVMEACKRARIGPQRFLRFGPFAFSPPVNGYVDLGFRNEVNIARFFWDHIDSNNETNDNDNSDMSTVAANLELMACDAGIFGADGTCNEPNRLNSGSCPFDTLLPGTPMNATRDSYNAWDVADALSGDQGTELLLNCLASASD